MHYVRLMRKVLAFTAQNTTENKSISLHIQYVLTVNGLIPPCETTVSVKIVSLIRPQYTYDLFYAFLF
jgi:hypothetical protein